MENSTSPSPNRSAGSPRPGISTLASMTSGSPSCGQTATNPPPSGETTPGSVHIATSIAATAASTAVPPASTTSRPARTAREFGAATAAVTVPILPGVGARRLSGPNEGDGRGADCAPGPAGPVARRGERASEEHHRRRAHPVGPRDREPDDGDARDELRHGDRSGGTAGQWARRALPARALDAEHVAHLAQGPAAGRASRGQRGVYRGRGGRGLHPRPRGGARGRRAGRGRRALDGPLRLLTIVVGRRRVLPARADVDGRLRGEPH